ncbi:MAG: ThiF family adenylyltransferase [Paracoccaceae bacterium]
MSALRGDDLERYARHLVLHEIGGPGQRRLRAARVLVVGAGGLGAPAILYLAAAGVGRLDLVDDDAVSLSNLQRQVLFATRQIGAPKVEAAAESVAALNPGVEVVPHALRLGAAEADGLVEGADVVLDGSDNRATRDLVNAACVRAGRPLVSAALGRWEGQIGVFHPAAGGPCYACAFPEAPAPGQVAPCAEAGVLGALAGVIGSMQAVEAVKLIVGAGEPLVGRLMLYDALSASARTLRVRPRADCAVCGRDARVR